MYTNDEERTGDFTFRAEGSSDPKSPLYYGKLAHPSADSGVTIGAGYDMGGRTAAQVKADLIGAGINADLAGKLAEGANQTTSAARQKFVDDNRATLVVNDLGALRKLFDNAYPGYVARAKAAFSYHAATFRTAMPSYGKEFKDATFFDWPYLYPAIRVIAIDLVYQGFGKQKAGYGKPLHFCMANNFDWLIHYIQTSPLNQYEKGRGRAAYLKSKKFSETAKYSNCPVAP